MLDAERTAVGEIDVGCEVSAAGMAVDIGHIVACCGSGQVLLDNGDCKPKPARVAAHLGDEQLTTAVKNRQDVLIAYRNGDPEQPIVVGLLRMPGDTAKRPAEPSPVEAVVDDETVVVEAKKQVVLRCGKASITLTRAGKVILRGTYVLSRSSGVNRIKGGSVQIN